MKLHTTLKYSEDEDKVENKIFKIQIIYKIDGVKNSIEKDVDVASFYKKNKELQSMKITGKPETLLKYKVYIFFKD